MLVCCNFIGYIGKKNILEVFILKGIKKNVNDVDDKLVVVNLLCKI